METESHVNHKTKKSADGFKIGLMALIVVVLCGVSFMAGMAFQKKQAKTTVANFSTNGGFGNGMMGGRVGIRGGLGTVTAVSASSISVKNDRTISTSTYNINSDTTVTNNGTASTIGAIKVGDTVIVQTSSSDTKKASRIIVNPTMPSGGPESGASTSNSIDDGAGAL